MNLTILTEKENIFSGEVKGVQLPGEAGRFEVLEGHAPLVSTLVSGQIAYRDDRGRHTVGIAHGVVTVRDDEIKILVAV